MKNTIYNIICGAYFLIFMTMAIFIIVFLPIVAISNINVIRTSGFAGMSQMALIWGLAMIIGPSLTIPVFRRMYYWFPWLFALIKIGFINIIIFVLGQSILSFGYRVQNPARHTTFFILMICFMVVGRALMCIYFHKKKVKYIGEGTHGK